MSMLSRSFKYCIPVIATAAGLAADHMRVEWSPSKFELAAQELGFSTEQQEAILKIDTMAGYFAGQKPWEDIYRSHIWKNPKYIYEQSVAPAIKASLADQANPYIVDIATLKEGLFGKSAKHIWEYFLPDKPSVTTTEVQQWIVSLAQNGFARPKGGERIDIKSPGEWLKLYEPEFTDATRKLGMIDRINPTRSEYDECWVAGATRLGVTARLIELKYELQHGTHIKGAIKTLAGGRLLNAGIIDGSS